MSEHSPWICDERVGAVAVYRRPRVNCFSELKRPAYYGSGKKVWDKDGSYDWAVPAWKVWWARFVCAALNALSALKEVSA